MVCCEVGGNCVATFLHTVGDQFMLVLCVCVVVSAPILCLVGYSGYPSVFVGCRVGGCTVVWRSFSICANLDLQWKHASLSVNCTKKRFGLLVCQVIC